MDAETFLGAILIAAWAAVVVRGLEQTAVAARKGRKWERAYLVGLGSPANAGTKNRWQAVTRAPTSREEEARRRDVRAGLPRGVETRQGGGCVRGALE